MDTVKLEWPIEILWHDGVKWRPFADSDPNAAMIARDEPEYGSLAYCIGKFGRFPDFPEPRRYGTMKTWKSAKPAITGLTTVHDGKARGLGFCSDT